MKRLDSWKEAWSLAPIATFVVAGMVVSGYDFFYLHLGVFNPPALAGGAFLIFIGGLLELTVRFTLIEKAGFGGLAATKRLLITDKHTLITNGVFRHIRHPLYLGRIVMDFGIALAASSLWGAVLMAVSAPCFLIRIRFEEEMLVEEFGEAYREYKRHTKMLIPWVY